MDFYTMLSAVYDDLFPAEPSIIRFLIDTFSSCQRVLDVACGTGTYTIPLWEQGKEVVGIDLSIPMIQQAREKLQQIFQAAPAASPDGQPPDASATAPMPPQERKSLPRSASPYANQGSGTIPSNSAPCQKEEACSGPQQATYQQPKAVEMFQVEDMLDLTRFPPGSFQGLYCIGNSLPHLISEAQIRTALAQFFRVLAPEGVLLLQTINFDRVRFDSSGRFTLPTLKGRRAELVRFYTPGPDPDHIYFESELCLSNDHPLRNRIPLFLLTRNRLETWLQDAGFGSQMWYGSYERKAYEPDTSFLSIVQARARAKGKPAKDTRADSIVP